MEKSAPNVFDKMFDISELQKLQDQFSNAFGVASIITYPDGKYITQPSNFSYLCQNIIRCTNKGLVNCMRSDAFIGRHNPDGATIQTCLSGGLCDAGASICVGGQHVANWLVGQVRSEDYDEEKLKAYAHEIGADVSEFLIAYKEIPIMPTDRFKLIADMLFTMARMLSDMAYKNLEKSMIIDHQQKIEGEIKLDEERLESLLAISSYQPKDISDLFCFALNESVKITRSELGYIYLYSEESKEFTLETIARNQTDSKIPENERHVCSISDMGFWGEVVDTRKPLISNYLTESVCCDHIPINRSLLLPVLDGTKLVAVVIVANKMSDYTDADCRQLMLMIDAVWKVLNRIKSNILLLESETKFRSLFENSPIGKSITKIDGTINVNNAFCEMIGYSMEELAGRKFGEITHPDDIELTDELLRKLLTGEQSQGSIEKRYIHKDGRIIWAIVSVFLQHDKDGNPDYFITIINDVTRQKAMEEALRESEFFFRESQKAARIGSYNFNVSTGIWTSSEVLDQIFGIEKGFPRDVDGWKDLIYPEDVSMMDHHLKVEVIGEKKTFNKEYRIVRKSDGAVRWVHGLGQLILDKSGNPVSMIGTIQDITERKNAERALQESEERYNAFINADTDMIFVKDDQCRYVLANEAMARFFDATKEHVLGKTDQELAENTRVYPCKSSDQRIIDKAETFTIEERLGNRIYEVTKFPLELRDYKRGIGGIMRDVTERKRDEEAIQNERQLLRTLIDNIPDSIFIKDINCRKVAANSTDIERMGFSSEKEALGKTDVEIYEGEAGVRGYADDLEVITTGVPLVNKEQSFDDRHGGIRWSVVSKYPLFDQNGKITGLVGITRDITEQKKAQETIIKLTKGIEQNPATIVITDKFGSIEYVNPRFSETTGYSLEEAIGQNPRILKSGEMNPEAYKNLWDKISSGDVWRGEFHNKKKNGELYWESATITSIKNDHGEITNYIAIKEDISMRKQMEADLIVSKEKAEESDRLKSAFLANMSHEIRTPLNSIIGFSELLIDSSFVPEQKDEFIQHIIENGNYLLNIISDIVDISKIEAGEIAIRKKPVFVCDLVEEVKRMYTYKIESQSLKFIINTPLCNEKIQVLCDRERVMQVITNLLNNALKFTTEGYIEVGYRELKTQVEFYVRDSGIGIPEKFHQKVFDRFTQVETSYSRRAGGNGLGLSISKNLIELMGGRIWLESEPGKGSTFFFTLEKC